MLLVIIGILIYLVIAAVIAAEFADIAQMKGHAGKKYFWYTFLFGPAGMLMVIALPYIKVEVKAPAAAANAAQPVNMQRSVQKELPVKKPEKRDNDVNGSAEPAKAMVVNGENVCPKCGLSQKADRRVCWSCGQRFEN